MNGKKSNPGCEAPVFHRYVLQKMFSNARCQLLLAENNSLHVLSLQTFLAAAQYHLLAGLQAGPLGCGKFKKKPVKR
jgi:hypothetical protein